MPMGGAGTSSVTCSARHSGSCRMWRWRGCLAASCSRASFASTSGKPRRARECIAPESRRASAVWIWRWLKARSPVERRRGGSRPEGAQALRAARELDAAFALRPELRSLADDSTIVCRCEDVRLGQLDSSWTTRQAKLYTRAGMGACQGRICGAALECVRSWPPDTVRPPLRPARVATLLPE